MAFTRIGRRVLLAAGVAALGIGLAGAQVVWAKSHSAATATVPAVSVTTTVTPSPVEPLDRITIDTAFKAPTEVAEPLAAHLEVRGAAGNAVLAMDQSGFHVPGQGARAIYWESRVPDSLADGKYSLHVKLVGLKSNAVYLDQDQATALTVSRTGQ